ncbi:MAG: hypothetical protein E6Q97_01430 [Desulfurellales bacterium]|nr:MAG: hypothetical protein E6Q97_01430 [Desulfurellales bacterium]
MPVALTPDEKSRVRRHLGYPETTSVSAYAMGIPTTVQGMFLVDSAVDHLEDSAADRVRNLLAILDGMEQKILKAICTLTVESVGDIRMRGAQQGMTGTDLLEREYRRWAQRLADCLGVPMYPYTNRFGGGINIPVSR